MKPRVTENNNNNWLYSFFRCIEYYMVQNVRKVDEWHFLLPHSYVCSRYTTKGKNKMTLISRELIWIADIIHLICYNSMLINEANRPNEKEKNSTSQFDPKQPALLLHFRYLYIFFSSQFSILKTQQLLLLSIQIVLTFIHLHTISFVWLWRNLNNILSIPNGNLSTLSVQWTTTTIIIRST